MVYLPEIDVMAPPAQKQIIEFGGYNNAPVIDDGQMRDMYNLSSDKYPNLSQRAKRGLYTIEGSLQEYSEPRELLARREKLAVVSGADFYYGTQLLNGKQVPRRIPGISLTPGEKQIVAINTRIVIYPDKIWYDTETDRSGRLDFTFTIPAGVTTTITNADAGSKIVIPGLPLTSLSGFSAGDAVEITGFTGGRMVSSPIKSVDSDGLSFASDAFLSIVGTAASTVIPERLTISRTSPNLEFVMESNNRLWGCEGNTIWASKLGDPLNWKYYQALSNDSFAVAVGTDGAWTGCCAYSNHLLFFKEDCIHKVYGSRPSEYQVRHVECHALEAGSHKSIAVINETVFYKSRLGIMAYMGNTPEHITENFGTKKYRNAVAGTDGIKYYVSMESDGVSDLYVFDLGKKLWHKEDHTRILDFAYIKGQLVYINEEDSQIYSLAPEAVLESEKDIHWMAELGDFDEFVEEKKVYSKIKLRINMEPDSEITVSIKHDAKDWIQVAQLQTNDKRTAFIPLIPIRCDKFRIRLEGIGYSLVESIVREYRERSER